MASNMSRGAGSGFAGGNYDFKKIMQWLGYALKCPICGHNYKLEQSRIIHSEQDEIYGEAKILIHSDCTKCKSSVMFNVEILGPEIFSVGMVTDLTKQDSSKFQNRRPIQANEIIDLHTQLAKFNGDFVGLLKK